MGQSTAVAPARGRTEIARFLRSTMLMIPVGRVLIVVGLLIGSGVLALVWINSQYYVAAQGDQVAIYQGVQGEVPVLGLRLSEPLDEPTGLALADLPDDLRNDVMNGVRIPEGGLDAARKYVQRLFPLRLPPCPPPSAPAPAVGGAVEVTPAQPAAPCRQEG